MHYIPPNSLIVSTVISSLDIFVGAHCFNKDKHVQTPNFNRLGLAWSLLDDFRRAQDKVNKLPGASKGSEGEVAGVAVVEKGEVNGDPQAMPGVLKRLEDNQGALELSRVGVAPKPGDMAGEGPTNLKEENYVNGITAMNGHCEVQGSYGNGSVIDKTEIQTNFAPGADGLLGQLPPEIEHITFGYLPLSTLITRLVQETFNGLTEAINEMSELQVSQPNHSDSHINGNGAGNNSQANKQKKLRMLNFAQDRRAQFIKILVLSHWSRQADAISKVIDLKVWLDGQKRIYDEASGWMGELKRVLGPLKMPNPDLATALEILTLGKASWLPDLGYIPLSPLSPQEILKGLRNINTLLSVRLNLHEKIPPSFRDFSIGSGRATFRVRDEFELDLSLADEDPSSQLYFLDFRFLFLPVPAEVSDGKLRDAIEGRTNDALKQDGLSGCYDFLHDLVLTHKLTILKHQAFEMAQGLWAHHIMVEEVRRSFIVQYWLNRPGGKHWIELGIKRRRENNPLQLFNSQDSPHVAIRWFRSGKEVTTFQINLRLGNLSFQRILKQIIAIHTTFVFEKAADQLRGGLIYSNRLLMLRHTASTIEPLDAALYVQLTMLKAVKIIQVPVTGRFALLPSSQLYSRAEIELNSLSNPTSEISARLANLRSNVSQDEVEIRAKILGWEAVKSLNPGQETMRRLFPRDTLRTRFFRRKSWNNSWILVFTSSLMGDSWWIAELGEMKIEGGLRESSLSRTGPSFKAAYRLPMDGFKSLVMEPSSSTLTQVERMAVGMISQYIDSRQLTIQKIPNKLRPTPGHSARLPSGLLYMRLTHGRAPAMLQSNSPLTPPWSSDIVTIAFQGLDPATNSAIHTVSARLRKPIPKIKSLISGIDYSVAFHPTSGAFAFRLLTPVGEPTIRPLLHRLSSIERLVQFLAVIKYHKLSCTTVSLTHLEFVYASNPFILMATVYFPLDAPMSISFEKGNPHLRIQDSITSLLRSAGGLDHVIIGLSITLPILRAFSVMEAVHSSDGVTILPRSAVWHQVRYMSAGIRFDVRIKQRRHDLMWLVKRLGSPKDEKITEKVEQGMKSIERGSGDGWRGMKGGMVASIEGVEALMAKINEVFAAVRNDKDENDKLVIAAPTGKKRKAEDEIVVLD